MKKVIKLLFILMVAVFVARESYAQLMYGTTATNFPVTGASNWTVIAQNTPNLVNRSIANTNALSDLLVSYVLPVVSGTPAWTNCCIVSNVYNGVTMGNQTNVPRNVVVVGSLAATVNFAAFTVKAATTTNVNIGAEMFGATISNLTLTSTSQVFTVDTYFQR